MFLEISQNLQENICGRISFLIKLQASDLQLYLKRASCTGVFLWILRNFLEHFRTTVFIKCISWRRLVRTPLWKHLKCLQRTQLHLCADENKEDLNVHKKFMRCQCYKSVLFKLNLVRVPIDQIDKEVKVINFQNNLRYVNESFNWKSLHILLK